MIASLAVLLRCSPRELVELEDAELATIVDVLAETNGRR
jgi:hypothetical protein